MLLAIDCGNTNIVFALYDGDSKRGAWRISTDVRRTADEYAVWLTELMRLQAIDRGEVTRAILASVVPDVNFNLITLVERYFSCTPLQIDHRLKMPINVKLDHPEEVGADRLVNALAGFRIYGGPLIVVDFGTATTFDVIDRSGAYIGGVICPGINLSLEALYMAAAKLPGISIERPDRVIGRNTISAMQSGIFWGYVGLIEGLITRIKTEYGAAMKVVATGGLAALFQASTPVIEEVDEDITLRGLVLIDRDVSAKKNE